MFEQRREKIMLVLALGLLGALVLDQMVVSPVWGYLSDVSARIAELKADVDEAERLERAAPQARRRAAAVRHGAGAQRVPQLSGGPGHPLRRGHPIGPDLGRGIARLAGPETGHL
jgi:hypothetical protein